MTRPTPIIENKYFNGYPPRKHKTNTRKLMIAAVEKFSGKISNTTNAVGSHKGKILSLKVIWVSLILVKYLAIHIIKTTDAKVEVWKFTPTNGILIHRLAVTPPILVSTVRVYANNINTMGRAIMDNPLK